MFRRPSKLLVLEADGYRLRAAVFSLRKSALELVSSAESSTLDPATALSEALQKLPSPLPRQAILLLRETTTAVVDLPVSPAEVRPAEQMRELVRWEIETVLAQQLASRPLEEILVGRGYLTADQVETLTCELQHRLSCGGGLQRLRFEDLAEESGLVTRPQLEECLQLQARQQATEHEDIECGWSPLPSVSAGADRHAWLACAVAWHTRTDWSDRLAQHKVELQAIYPLVGPAASLPHLDASAAAVVLHIQPGLVGVSHWEAGQLTAWEILDLFARRKSLPEACAQAVQRANSPVYLTGRVDIWPNLTDELTALIRRPVLLLPTPPELAVHSAMSSAACHWWQLVPASTSVFITARDPAPPFYKQPAVHTALVLLGVVGVLLLFEAGLMTKRGQMQTELDTTTQQLNLLNQSLNRLETEANQAKQLQPQLDETKSNIQRLQRQRQFVQEQLPGRHRFLMELLTSLGEAAREDVVIDEVSQVKDQEIHLRGWALSHNAAQEFLRTLTASAPRWKLSVAPSRVWEKEGRLGLDGYALDLRLLPATTPPVTQLVDQPR